MYACMDGWMDACSMYYIYNHIFIQASPTPWNCGQPSYGTERKLMLTSLACPGVCWGAIKWPMTHSKQYETCSWSKWGSGTHHDQLMQRVWDKLSSRRSEVRDSERSDGADGPSTPRSPAPLHSAVLPNKSIEGRVERLVQGIIGRE